jgi:hypothetical protein
MEGMWKAIGPLLNEVSREKPSVGRTVRVLRGKRAGTVGVVTHHIQDQYVNAFRYGFAVKIDNQFWTKADNTMVCVD